MRSLDRSIRSQRRPNRNTIGTERTAPTKAARDLLQGVPLSGGGRQRFSRSGMKPLSGTPSRILCPETRPRFRGYVDGGIPCIARQRSVFPRSLPTGRKIPRFRFRGNNDLDYSHWTQKQRCLASLSVDIVVLSSSYRNRGRRGCIIR